MIEIALEIATKLQESNISEINQGIHPDTIVFRDEGQSFKIGDEGDDHESVRGLIKWSSQKPTSEYRIAVLENLERTSLAAPQALLKLVEEPPSRAVFLFTTQNHHQILDTILSRMTVVRVPRECKDFEVSEEIQDFLEGNDLISKFQKIEALVKAAKEEKDKAVIFDFLHEMILHARKNERHCKMLDLLLETHIALKQNVNSRLALERLALKLKV